MEHHQNSVVELVCELLRTVWPPGRQVHKGQAPVCSFSVARIPRMASGTSSVLSKEYVNECMTFAMPARTVHWEKDSKLPSSPFQLGVKSLSEAGVDEGTSPMALLPKPVATGLKVWGLYLMPPLLRVAHLEDKGVGLNASFLLQAFTMQ